MFKSQLKKSGKVRSMIGFATAYSCQQKLIQAAAIQNPRLKEMALMQLVSDAENSRNLLMQSQSANAAFIKNQPESTWGQDFIRRNARKDKCANE